MKKYWLPALICAEGLLCLAAALFIPVTTGGGLMAAEQFPLAQIGDALRALSLSGGVGNAVALVLYIAICCVPNAFVIAGIVRRTAKPEDIILAVLSVYLLYSVYMMINPADIAGIGPGMDIVGKGILGGIFWSILISWLALRLMHFVRDRDSGSVLGMMGLLLALTAVFIVFFITYFNVTDLKASFKSLEAGNSGGSFIISSTGEVTQYDGLISTKVFMVFKFIVVQIPAVIDVIILLSARKLAGMLRADRYGEEVVKASQKLAVLCKYAVAITVISSAAINLLQLLFAPSLRSSDYNVTVPLLSIILALGMLLLSRYLSESRDIKQENDMFV